MVPAKKKETKSNCLEFKKWITLMLFISELFVIKFYKFLQKVKEQKAILCNGNLLVIKISSLDLLNQEQLNLLLMKEITYMKQNMV